MTVVVRGTCFFLGQQQMWLSKFALILPGFYYPIAYDTSLLNTRPQRAVIEGRAWCVYRDPHLIVHDDVCPHQGASLSRSAVLTTPSCRRLRCPYHHIVFEKGRFCGIGHAGTVHTPGKQAMQLMPTITDGLLVYTAPSPLPCLHGLYIPPELGNGDFRGIHGVRDFDVAADLVVENLLDNMHISAVHTFGVPGNLAKGLAYHDTGATSGRTTFRYSPRRLTLGTLLGKGQDVFVENEFHLPTTTVTRVSVGSAVKTVVTRARPVGANKTRLYWSLYRNFATHPLLDSVMRHLMEQTLNEDAAILADATWVGSPRLTVPYDVTILKYRDAFKRHSYGTLTSHTLPAFLDATTDT
jgi:phenylpropionate dioxygenase-like ring-hydroxylating dioxygenase large terminal subunit